MKHFTRLKGLLLVFTICLIVIGCGGGGKSTTPPVSSSSPGIPPGDVDFSLVGFAAMGSGTTGGQGASTTVSTGTALQAAIDAAKAGTGPKIIYVDGTINLSNSGSLERIELKGNSESNPLSNISILGVADRGELNGIGIWMRYVSNIIIRNLKIHHVLASTGEGDAIGIQGPANHIWVDHCELYNSTGDLDGNGTVGNAGDKDRYDGLFDVKYESEYITFSWNYVHDSYKTSLIGYSDTGDITFDRKITYHHNYFNNCNSRTPLYRGGTGHVYNNYFNNLVESGVNCRRGSVLRVENNHFENSDNPIGWFYDDVNTGFWDVSNNRFDSCTGSQPTTSTGTFAPPYSYVMNAVNSVKSIVTTWAGVNKVDVGSGATPSPTPTATVMPSPTTSADASPTPTPTAIPFSGLTENFDSATSATFFTAGYKALPGDSGLPMYKKTGGTVSIESGTVKIVDGRFTIGDKGTATTSTTNPNGALDLSKPYKISFKVIAVEGTAIATKTFQVLVDNNTTSSGNSIHGASSKIYSVVANTLTGGQTYLIQSSFGTTTSFIQLRTESGVTVTIDDLVIEYQ